MEQRYTRKCQKVHQMFTPRPSDDPWHSFTSDDVQRSGAGKCWMMLGNKVLEKNHAVTFDLFTPPKGDVQKQEADAGKCWMVFAKKMLKSHSAEKFDLFTPPKGVTDAQRQQAASEFF